MKKIPIAITVGEVSGIGPEVVLKSLIQKKVLTRCQPIVVGSLDVLRSTAKTLGIRVSLEEYGTGGSLFPGDHIPVVDVGEIRAGDFNFGEPTRLTGKNAWEAIIAGAQLAQAGVVRALVTAPVSKKAINASGHPFTGHTELLAALTGARQFAMMFVSPRLKITLVTTHLSLKEVAGSITPRTIRLRREGHSIEGPFAADTIFTETNLKNFDAFLAMYHDQGLIPLKIAGVGRSVNLTLGLPFIRTSPDFGCAFEIAGKGAADASGMTGAINLAIDMCRKKGIR